MTLYSSYEQSRWSFKYSVLYCPTRTMVLQSCLTLFQWEGEILKFLCKVISLLCGWLHCLHSILAPDAMAFLNGKTIHKRITTSHIFILSFFEGLITAWSPEQKKLCPTSIICCCLPKNPMLVIVIESLVFIYLIYV